MNAISCRNSLPCGGGAQTQSEPLDAAGISLQHLEFEAVVADDLSALRYPADERHHQTSQCVDVLFGIVRLKGDAGLLGEILQIEPRVGLVTAIAELGQLRGLVDIMLVSDFADNLLDQILDRNQPVGAAIFID